jgi:hypothetical protein
MFIRPSLTHLAPATIVALLGVGGVALAQSHTPRLSDDLRRHVAAGDTSDSRVVITGSQAAVDALASRHGLQITRRLSSGAVLTVPAGKLAAVANDPSVPSLSGDHIVRGQMAVTDEVIGATQAWAGLPGVQASGVTGRGIGVALIDSGVSLVPELVGRIDARVDIANPRGNGRDEFGQRLTCAQRDPRGCPRRTHRVAEGPRCGWLRPAERCGGSHRLGHRTS